MVQNQRWGQTSQDILYLHPYICMYVYVYIVYIYYLYLYLPCIHTYIHIHTYILRMGTRLQYDLCSHVYSHYPSTAKGSLLPPLWLKYHCRSPEKTIANAEAVHLLLSLWLRTDHSCINKEHIHIGENLRFTGYQPYVSYGAYERVAADLTDDRTG